MRLKGSSENNKLRLLYVNNLMRTAFESLFATFHIAPLKEKLQYWWNIKDIEKIIIIHFFQCDYISIIFILVLLAFQNFFMFNAFWSCPLMFRTIPEGSDWTDLPDPGLQQPRGGYPCPGLPRCELHCSQRCIANKVTLSYLLHILTSVQDSDPHP